MSSLGLSTLIEDEKKIIFTYPNGGPNTAYYLYPEPLKDGNPQRKGGVFSIQVDKIEEILKKCKDKHLVSDDVTIYAQEGFVSFMLEDPDGNLFEIIQKKE
jgi:hypothetical protein